MVSSEIVEGFRSSAKLAGCRLTIQNVNINPWCIIGGIATSVCRRDEIVMPNHAQPGDVIVLTKPLGTQLATNAQIWREENAESWQKLSDVLTHAQVDEIYAKAVKSMTTLNMQAAKLMRKFNAHAATDITGFGLVGHAENLLQFQDEKVDFVITKFPIIQHVRLIAETLDRMASTMAQWSKHLVDSSSCSALRVRRSFAMSFVLQQEATNAGSLGECRKEMEKFCLKILKLSRSEIFNMQLPHDRWLLNDSNSRDHREDFAVVNLTFFI